MRIESIICSSFGSVRRRGLREVGGIDHQPGPVDIENEQLLDLTSAQLTRNHSLGASRYHPFHGPAPDHR